MSRTSYDEISAARVKELGDQIGYGNLMCLASALWRKMLIERAGNGNGAFVPTIRDFSDKSITKECELYDEIVKDI